MDIYLQEIIDQFNDITGTPENFLSVHEETCNKAKSLLKNIYNFTKDVELKAEYRNNALPKLMVDAVDVEQIWQQVELQNSEILNENNILNISKLLSNSASLFHDASLENKTKQDINEEQTDQETDENDEEDSESDSVINIIKKSEPEKLNVNNKSANKKTEEISKESDEEENNSTESSNDEFAMSSDHEDLSAKLNEESGEENEERFDENKPEVNKNEKHFKKKSVVDDDFFKLDEMENFLNSEEQKINKCKTLSGNDEYDSTSDQESIDLFKTEGPEELEDEENLHLKNPRFKDFFKKQDKEPRKEKRNKFLKDLDENVLEENGRSEKIQKSKYEERDEKLKEKIKEIEEKALHEKPWTMKGEISAEKRPLNSLLEEVVEFDHVSRPAPIITEEAAQMLEDVIMQRIKDKAFDDVERKKRLIETPLEYKKKLVLEQEKSKESLAQIYEKEYLQQLEALTADPLKNEEEPELHKEIKSMRQILFTQLDSLSNFHFTPKSAAPELKIVTNLPAISMEEVAPVAASDAALLAPEEVKRKQRGDFKSKEERTATDKKRERRKKKLKQKIHAQEKDKRKALSKQNIKPNKTNKQKKGNKNAIKSQNVAKMNESLSELKSVKSSQAFFDKLQDQIKTQINGKIKGKRSQKTKQNFDAKRIKL
ncbi:U3 small nucleolar ribonucleoprotein protein MPP10 isoform X2 [Agrilus planipennis]|uniref:U3 small nucleolar ribonucleoprotein protein MPP10 n=1 Tax=Agrilus planipennis TaxID=224129 RepID=A0A1W4XB50_AGRPL|nr:U3 small nucleolar ribonucleoprotein protein MPP10 isoform X1 [Agrilus planipennis]XP_025830304.1 U3 small nucleolar ribonucleoprotein protein MPP10 isoform X2 [Agrilus planipennis]